MQEYIYANPQKILLADDEKAIRTGLWHIVKRVYSRLEVLEAANGLEAWDIISATTDLSLAFVDIRMPGLDGLQLCEKIYQNRMAVKVVIVSGFREFDYARQAMRYDVQDYLLKPVNPKDVLRLVSEALQIRGEYKTPLEQAPIFEGHNRLIVERLRSYIHDHLERDITLAEIAEDLHYTPNYLSTLFKRETGKGFVQYLAECRMQRAKHLLKEPSLRMFEIAQQVGYTNAKAFSIAFRKFFDISPSEYRESQGIESID